MTELEELKEELEEAIAYRDRFEAKHKITSYFSCYKILMLRTRIKHLEQGK